jgi:hypothetical protein
VPDADEELEAAGEPEGEGPGPTSPGSGAEDDANEEEGAPGCGGAAPILAGASTSSGSGLRNTLRKPTSDRVTVPAEVPDADAELGSAVDREVEAAPGSGTGSISVIKASIETPWHTKLMTRKLKTYQVARGASNPRSNAPWVIYFTFHAAKASAKAR